MLPPSAMSQVRSTSGLPADSVGRAPTIVAKPRGTCETSLQQATSHATWQPESTIAALQSPQLNFANPPKYQDPS